MKTTFDHNSQSFLIDLIQTGKSLRATMGDKTVDVEILRAENGQLELLFDGERVTAYVSSDMDRRWVTIHGRTYRFDKSTGRKRIGGKRDHSGELTAPMPGQVRAVNVSVGDTVEKGQTLVVLEAMKMEIRIQAPMAGVVSSVSVEAGGIVEREQLLIIVEGR